MATNTTRTSVSKPSFASVSGCVRVLPSTQFSSQPDESQIAAMAPSTMNGQSHMKSENLKPSSVSPPKLQNKATVKEAAIARLPHELHKSISRLAVNDNTLSSSPLNDQQKSNISRAGLKVDDVQTQISSSSTKAASLDGKSTTSATTFALDEKESLRPDDSASVKAGDEDDFGSGPASGAQNSRVGSEAGSRAFRDQFYEITENIGSVPHRLHSQGRRIITGIEEEGPQLTQSPRASALPAPVDLPVQLMANTGPSMEYKYQEPDEKLLEALETPKDRSFLLGLEQDVVTFIKDPTYVV